MQVLSLQGHMGAAIVIEMCAGCQLFWFDRHESVRLAPASTLQLFETIGHHASARAVPVGPILRCPRCRDRLLGVTDMQRRTRFRYWRCDRCSGRLTAFLEFLKEKDFIRPMPPERVEELRRHVRTTNCSNCGAAIDLTTSEACGHCGSPLSMFDMTQAEGVVEQLREAARPKPLDPALPLALARARRQTEQAFAGLEQGDEWWRDASANGVVGAGLAALARWLRQQR